MLMKIIKKSVSFIVVFIFICSFIFPCYAESISEIYEESQREFFTDNIIVLIKKEYSEFGKEYSPADFDTELIESVEVVNQINPGDDTSGYDLEYWQQILSLNLRVPNAENVEKAIKTACDNPEVQVAHKNYKYTLDSENEFVDNSGFNDLLDEPTIVETNIKLNKNNENFSSRSIQRIGITPNDTYFDNQSGIFFSKANRAWAFTTGSNNVRVGIVDTGIDSHEDVEYDVSLSKNFTNEVSLSDNIDHGTHVAGIIGASTNNSRGVAGVCWNVTLVNLKVFQVGADGNPESSIYWLTDAIQYASQKAIRLLNISLEYEDLTRSEIETLEASVNSFNGLIVCAAGNVHSDEQGETQEDIQYLSQLTSGKIVSVASCNNSGVLAASSKYDPDYVDLITQGVSVYSTVYSTYDYMGGTSMATPFVTGAAALLLSINPNYTWMQLRTAILGMVDVDDAYSDFVAMSGKLNILQSVLVASGYAGVGDVDMNGSITAADARLALRISAQLETCTAQQAVMIDVNYDDSITAADAQTILSMSAGTSSA